MVFEGVMGVLYRVFGSYLKLIEVGGVWGLYRVDLRCSGVL